VPELIPSQRDLLLLRLVASSQYSCRSNSWVEEGAIFHEVTGRRQLLDGNGYAAT